MVEYKVSAQSSDLDHNYSRARIMRAPTFFSVLVCLTTMSFVRGGASPNNSLHQLNVIPSLVSFRAYLRDHVLNSILLRGGNISDEKNEDTIEKNEQEPKVDIINTDLSSDANEKMIETNFSTHEDSHIFQPENIPIPADNRTEHIKESYFEEFIPDEFRLQEENKIFEAEEADFPDNFPDTDVEGDDLHPLENTMGQFPDTDVEGEDHPLQDMTPNVSASNDISSSSHEVTPYPTHVNESTIYEPQFNSVNTVLATDEDSSAYLDRMDLADAYDDDEDADPKESILYTSSSTDHTIQGIKADDVENAVMKSSTVVSMSNDGKMDIEEEEETGASTAKVQYMITEQMKRVLLDELGYSKYEVENLKPDVATVLVSKMLKCPKNGMPEAFYIDGRVPKSLTTQKSSIVGISKTVVSRVIIPALAVGAAWGLKVFLDGSQTQSTSMPGKKGTNRKKIKAGVRFSKKGLKASKKSLKSKKAKKTKTATIQKLDESFANKPNTSSSRDLVSTSLTSSSQRKEEELGEMIGTSDEHSPPQTKTITKDLDKTWFDRIITGTLEKLDDLFKRPF